MLWIPRWLPKQERSWWPSLPPGKRSRSRAGPLTRPAECSVWRQSFLSAGHESALVELSPPRGARSQHRSRESRTERPVYPLRFPRTSVRATQPSAVRPAASQDDLRTRTRQNREQTGSIGVHSQVPRRHRPASSLARCMLFLETWLGTSFRRRCGSTLETRRASRRDVGAYQ